MEDRRIIIEKFRSRVSRMGITGSPSTGKSSVGEMLHVWTGMPHLDVSEVCRRAGAGKQMAKGDFVLDEGLAVKAVRKVLQVARAYIVEGAFLWDLIPESMLDIVVVLRCNPLVLAKRYRKAGYSKRKTKDNVVAEAIGYVHGSCMTVYGKKCLEVDVTGLDLERASDRVLLAVVTGRGDRVDWLARAPSDKELMNYLT